MRWLHLLPLLAWWSPLTALRQPHSPSRKIARAPSSPLHPLEARSQLQQSLLKALSVASALTLLPRRTDAIGRLFEFRDAPAIFQDVSFNVINTDTVTGFFEATFPDLCQVLRYSRQGNKNSSVIGFGAEAYESPKTFIPGVSSFYEDGGHATLSFHSEELGDGTFALYEPGNGLQYIKIGLENFRISKAMERGAKIKYAYGWVDLDGPSEIPLQMVVGVARDPLMLVCIRVSSMQQSVDFFTNDLGMRVMPYPYARPQGSTFEQQQPDKSVYLTYAKDSLGLLLVPSEKGSPTLNVGNELRAFTFIVDDISSNTSPPPLVSAYLNGGPSVVYSPDGYPIELKRFSEFAKIASKSIRNKA